MTCSGCGGGLLDSALSCPQCRALVHAAKLQDLAHRAGAEWRLGHFAEERSLWRESLALLPADTVQHRSITDRIEEIERMLDGSTQSTNDGWKKASVGIGPMLLLLLGKGKFLLLGLTKIGTLLTMFASLGVYWTLYGWALALGVVVSIYIHEMGHVGMIRRYGFPATAPMFIPGIGAFIQLRGVRLPPIPDSRIGLAGPMYGLGASLGAMAVYYVTGVKVWGAIAHFGAWVNLFNLIPVWQLDGSRGIRSLTRYQRGLVLGTAGTLWLLSSNPMLFLISAGCAYRMFTPDWQQETDNRGLLQFVGLLLAFTVIVMLLAPSVAVTKPH
jgi:Zn-dependent protease